MIPKSKITSLSELKLRQKQVRMETSIAQRELTHTLGATRGNATKTILKKYVYPAAAGIVGLLFLASLGKDKKKNQLPVIKETRVIHEYPDGKAYPSKRGLFGNKTRTSRFKKLTALIGIFRVAMPIIQTVIGAFNSHKAKQAAQTASRAAVRK